MVFVAVICYGLYSTRNICKLLYSIGVNFKIYFPKSLKPSIQFTHIICSGGPKHVYNQDRHNFPDWVLNNSCPKLAICYSMQLLTVLYGGTVINTGKLLKSLVKVYSLDLTPCYRWIYKYDKIVTIPENFEVIEVMDNGDIAAITYNDWIALQYHPENPQDFDQELFINFLRNL